MSRRICCCLFSVLLVTAGCAKSSDENRRAQHARAGLMGGPGPEVDLGYLADQAQVKLLPDPGVTFQPYEIGVDKSALASAGSGGMPGGAAPGGGSWWQRIAGRLKSGGSGEPPTGMPMPGMTPDDATPSDDAPADAGDAELAGRLGLVDKRPVVNAMPPKPGARPGMDLESARTGALADARSKMKSAILDAEIEDEWTLADDLDVDSEDAELELANIEVVAMSWVDGDRLEVEVQITVENVLGELKTAFPDADLSDLEELDQQKCFVAKGVGGITVSRPNPRAGVLIPSSAGRP